LGRTFEFNAAFTITVHNAFGYFRRVMTSMARQNRRPKADWNNELSIPVQSTVPASGTTVLDLVYQAEEVFDNIRHRARETEARAHAWCEVAGERLRHAEMRIQSAESAQREIIADADRMLQVASRALALSELRISAAEDRATAAEARAQMAEVKAREAKQALTLVEDAIRRRLLCVGHETIRQLGAFVA
jgi:hypothetical protein